MDPYTLPTDFNVIVVGTGLVESVVSAAASRVGKTVLHIDNQPNYGGDWASFSLESIQHLSKYCQSDPSLTQDKLAPCQVGTHTQMKDIEIEWHIPQMEEVTESGDFSKWSQARLMEKSNKFIIDLAPKLHYGHGALVELLISSNIARYTEFRSVSRIMVYYDNKLDTIPCSRNDIFSNSHVNVIEKRLLMKFFTSIIDGGDADFADIGDKTLKEVLIEKQLTPRCIHYILHAIAMTTADEPCVTGIAKVKRFLNSIGRFGKTPFLYCMWGSAEIPQSFCRISAVFGGVYALNQPLKEYKFDEKGNFTSLLCGEQEIHADKLVTGLGSRESLEGQEYVSRCILLTDSSVVKSESEHLSLILFPSDDGMEMCYVIEAGSRTGTTMDGVYCVYLLTKHKTNPKDDLKYYIDKLYNEVNEESSPKILWSCYFSMPVASDFETVGNNGFLCPGPEMDLDYDASIEQAKSIFKSMYPEDEFLPRAPDPEEIIIGDDDEESNELKQQRETQSEKTPEEDIDNLEE